VRKLSFHNTNQTIKLRKTASAAQCMTLNEAISTPHVLDHQVRRNLTGDIMYDSQPNNLYSEHASSLSAAQLNRRPKPWLTTKHSFPHKH